MLMFDLVFLRVSFVRALLIGLGGFALIQYLRHRSACNLAFATGGLLIASGATLELVVQNFFGKTVATGTAISIRFPVVPYRLGMVLVIVGSGICVVTGILHILAGRKPGCDGEQPP